MQQRDKVENIFVYEGVLQKKARYDNSGLMGDAGQPTNAGINAESQCESQFNFGGGA